MAQSKPTGLVMQTMALADLVPADYNPRKALQPGDAAYEQLKRSILTFGYVDPIIWNRRTGKVVGGHQRLSVLKALGHTETEVSVVDLNEEDERALNIALNKVEGEWDMERLRMVLADLDAAGYDLDLTGFSAKELEKILAPMPELDEGAGDGSGSGPAGIVIIVTVHDQADAETLSAFCEGKGFEWHVQGA